MIVVFVTVQLSSISRSLGALDASTLVEVEPAHLTQLITVLVVGLAIAFALQVVLFSFGSAIALSILKSFFGPSAQPSFESSEPKQTNSSIGAIAGLGILSTVNIVLFAASFLAVTFTQFNHPVVGAIAGMTLWAVYCLLLLWLSVKTVNSVAEFFLNLTTAGLRRVFSSVIGLFKQQKVDAALTQAQIESILQQEIQAGLETLQEQLKAEAMIRPVEQPMERSQLAPTSNHKTTHQQFSTQAIATTNSALPESETVWQQLQTFVKNASAKKLTPKAVDQTLAKLLQALAETGIDKAKLPDLNELELSIILATRKDLSDKKRTRLAHQIRTAWEAFRAEAPESSAFTNTSQPDSPATELYLPGSIPDTSMQTMEALSQQVLTKLPGLLQKYGSELVPLATMLTPANLEQAIAPLITSLNSPEFTQQLEQLLAQSQSSLADLNQTFGNQAEQLRDRTIEQLSSLQHTIQQGVQTRITALQQDAHNRLEATRKTATTAAWWLFFTICTGGLSAALAGAIAAGFNPMNLVNAI